MKPFYLTILLIFFSTSAVNAQQEEYTAYLKRALEYVENNNEKLFNVNLKYFTVAIDRDEITPEILTEENLKLYTRCLYMAVIKEYKFSDDLVKNAVVFLKYNIDNYPANMNSLGYMYQFGYGIEKNYEYAKYWYERGIENGEVFSINNLGIMYYLGHGVPKDLNIAKYWFEKAAIEKDDPQGMYNLGTVYLSGGDGIAQDYSKAIYWFQKAAGKGLGKAMNNLGTIYYHGQGVEKNYVTAKEWFEKAIENENLVAMNNLANLYLYGGYGMVQDEFQAKHWFEKAVETGSTAAMIGLGVLYENNSDLSQAKNWYRKACDLGNATGCENLELIN